VVELNLLELNDLEDQETNKLALKDREDQREPKEPEIAQKNQQKENE
jgi:hypothetical protein